MRVRDPRSIFFLKISRSVRSSRESFLITGSTVGNDDERALSYRRHWREERVGETYRIKGDKIRCSMISASVCILQDYFG